MLKSKIDTLNSLLSSPELESMAMRIMLEYHDSIDDMLKKNQEADVKEMIYASDDKLKMFNNIEQVSNEATAFRMNKYGAIFFDEEIERLLDNYNSGVLDKSEFNIRCAVLSALTETLVEFGKEDSDGVTDNAEGS